MSEELIFFKKNVPYPVGVRFFPKDTQGKTLTTNDPYIVLKREQLRDFRRANAQHINAGLIIQTEEPYLDDETPNAITDEQAEAMVKNVIVLKNTLKTLTAEAPVVKLLEEARLQGRSEKTIALITDRLKEIVGETPEEMKGVE